MKLLKFSLLALLVVGFVACGDDDPCDISEWAGVYTGGTESCVSGETGGLTPY